MEQRIELRKRIIEALEPHQEIVFAYLHGSFLDKYLPYHDVDVAVYLDPPWIAPQDIFEYQMALSVDLTLALHVPIDVHVINEAPLGFQHSVLYRGEMLLSRDAERLTAFIERVGLAYMEFSYYVQDYLQEVTS